MSPPCLALTIDCGARHWLYVEAERTESSFVSRIHLVGLWCTVRGRVMRVWGVGNRGTEDGDEDWADNDPGSEGYLMNSFDRITASYPMR